MLQIMKMIVLINYSKYEPYIVKMNCLNISMNFPIDQPMKKFCGQNIMRQYMPAEPLVRYGFKAWMRADDNEFYLYEGKKNLKVSLGAKVVKTLRENLEGLCYHGYIDNYFMSVT